VLKGENWWQWEPHNST